MVKMIGFMSKNLHISFSYSMLPFLANLVSVFSLFSVFFAKSHPHPSQMGGPPLRGNYVIDTPRVTPTSYSFSLCHAFSSPAVCYKLDRSGYASPSLSNNEAATEP